jgi:hypothetical protein
MIDFKTEASGALPSVFNCRRDDCRLRVVRRHG